MRSLGGAVVLLVAAACSRDEEPAEMPAPVRVEGSEAMKSLDAATVNVEWVDVTVEHLPLLARLPALRRLHILSSSLGGAAWEHLTEEQFAPVSALAALEELSLPPEARLTTAHLRRLAQCMRLRAITFAHESLTLDAVSVVALATWPALRRLTLQNISLRPEGVAGLASLRGLTELELVHNLDLDEVAFASVCELHTLQRLSLTGLGSPLALRGLVNAGRTWALTTAAMRQMAAMPSLRELELKACTIDAALLRELPETLTSLVISGQDLDVSCIQALRRCGGLRTLRLREAGANAKERAALRRATAELLGSLHLQRFSWRGDLSAELQSAVAAQPDLRELELFAQHDFAFLVGLHHLERLDLWPRVTPHDEVGAGFPPPLFPRRPTAEALEALRAITSLRVVAYHEMLPDTLAAELRHALGPNIALHVVLTR